MLTIGNPLCCYDPGCKKYRQARDAGRVWAGGQLPIKILADLESKPVATKDLLLLLAPIDFQIFRRLCNLQAYGSLWLTIVRRATNPLTQ